MLTRRSMLLLSASVAGFPFLARAQSYPTKPIKFIVATSAATGTDAVARYIAGQLKNHLPQPVFIENKDGAGGLIATEFASRLPPDGYNVLITNSAHFTYPWIYDKLGFDPQKDLAPVAVLVASQTVLIVPPNSPFNSVQDVLAEARKNPGKLSYAHGGNGSLTHIAGELMNLRASIKVNAVPYKAASQVVLDTMSGQVNMGYAGIASAIANIKGGRLRALAVTSQKRALSLPSVPTMEESGVPDYDLSTPIFALVPAGTPASVIANLSDAIVAVASTPAFKEFCIAQGLELDLLDAVAMKPYMPRMFSKWKSLVALASAKPT